MTPAVGYTEMKDSGIEWIGEIPAHWRMGRVKNCFFSTKTIVGDNAGNYDRLALTMKGVVKRSKSDGAGLQPEKFETYQILNENELVLKLIDLQNVSTSRVGLSPYVGIVSPAYIVLHSKNDKPSKYAEYFFLAMWMHQIFNQLGADGVRSNIGTSALLNLPFPIIPAKEQSAIAAYLDTQCAKIDEIIAEAKASIEDYKQWKASIIYEAVTKGLDPTVEMKDSGVEWIGEIPKGWKLNRLKYMFAIKKDIIGEIGHTVLAITQQGIKPKNMSDKGQFALDYSKYQIVNPGDFAMNHMDLLTGWVDISQFSGVTSPDYRVFYSLKDEIGTDYYKHLFQTCYRCRVFYGLGQGVSGLGRWRLPAEMFLNFVLPVPPLNEQKEIATFLGKECSQIDALTAEKQALITDLEAYKKSLIYEVVTGKRKVC